MFTHEEIVGRILRRRIGKKIEDVILQTRSGLRRSR
jgi:hypothetical protein